MELAVSKPSGGKYPKITNIHVAELKFCYSLYLASSTGLSKTGCEYSKFFTKD